MPTARRPCWLEAVPATSSVPSFHIPPRHCLARDQGLRAAVRCARFFNPIFYIPLPLPCVFPRYDLFKLGDEQDKDSTDTSAILSGTNYKVAAQARASSPAQLAIPPARLLRRVVRAGQRRKPVKMVVVLRHDLNLR